MGASAGLLYITLHECRCDASLNLNRIIPVFSKITSTVAAASLALISVSAMAAETTSHNIKLAATVPSTNFQVNAVLLATENDTHQLAYNSVTGAFAPFTAQFQVKSTSAVKASLGTLVSNKLYKANGDAMDVEVKFNNIVLDNVPKEVLATATVLSPYPLVITPSITQSTTAGTYNGTVSLVFESTL
jgi:hypothetical protein